MPYCSRVVLFHTALPIATTADPQPAAVPLLQHNELSYDLLVESNTLAPAKGQRSKISSFKTLRVSDFATSYYTMDSIRGRLSEALKGSWRETTDTSVYGVFRAGHDLAVHYVALKGPP